MVKALVTGASGFVGKYMVDRLLNQGIEVVATSRSVKHAVDTNRVQIVECDLTNYFDVQSLINGHNFHYIYHLGAIALSHSYAFDQYYQTNVIGTLSLLESVMQSHNKFAKILLVSSSFVYGDCSQIPINEEYSLLPNNHYASSKLLMENSALQYIHKGLDIVIARPFNHIGVGQSDQYVCMSLAKQFAKIKLDQTESVIRAGNIGVKRDFTDVRDVVRAYEMILNNVPSGEVINVCRNESVSIYSIIKMLSKISGVEVEVEQRKDLMRKHDLDEIRGDNSKLYKYTKWVPEISLMNTLTEMYEHCYTKLK